jgi:preprotein translocase subunit SecD
VTALLLLAFFAANPGVTLDVRLVVNCSNAKGAPQVKDPDGAGTICLDRAPFLTERDVESAEVRRSSSGKPVIFLTFHPDAAMRELQVTLKNVGHRVAIGVSGIVVSAPTIPGGSRFLFIDGNFTKPQAESIVAAFNSQARR